MLYTITMLSTARKKPNQLPLNKAINSGVKHNFNGIYSTNALTSIIRGALESLLSLSVITRTARTAVEMSKNPFSWLICVGNGNGTYVVDVM